MMSWLAHKLLGYNMKRLNAGDIRPTLPCGIITGSGTHALPGFEGDTPDTIATPYGETALTRGVYAGVEAIHLSRHGEGHARLSNQVTHRANIWALKELGATAIIAS